MIIAVDFDGTIVEHRYPKIGKEKPFAMATLKKLLKDGHHLILWTVREGKLLDEAVEYCRSKGIEFHAVNSSIGEDSTYHGQRKISADIFIDDRNIGGLPDWGDLYNMIDRGLTWESIAADKDHRKISLFDRLMRKL